MFLTNQKGKFNQSYTEGDENLTEIYSQPPSIIAHHSMMNRSNNQLNTSSISFDLLNSNANIVKTRYDVKSLSNNSLYGSRVLLVLPLF
jgi:hypothetical protein